MSAVAEHLPVPRAPPSPFGLPRIAWRRWLIGKMLYGSGVDRPAKARARIGLAIVAFATVYAAIAVRLVMFALASNSHMLHRVVSSDAIATARPDILDRNGEVLATDVRVPSLYAEPRRLIDVDEAAELLTADLPDLDAAESRERLSSKRGFVWLRRDITPEQQREIYRQGLPGIGFLNENKRDYPDGAEISHLLGHVNIDNQGIAGMEKWLDGQGLAALHMAGLATDRLQNPVQLAVDLRVQHVLHEELSAARAKFGAIAAAGLVLNVRTGEVVALVSEPDYDPNNPHDALDPTPIACEIVLGLQTMITRRIPVFDPAVIPIARMEVGTTDNIIPEVARLWGTLRTQSERTRRLARARSRISATCRYRLPVRLRAPM